MPFRIFVGYDPRESVAYHVLAQSILRYAGARASVTPLVQSRLRADGLYRRERGPTESTEFSITRFLVPYLSNYEGASLYLDCDMLCLADPMDLFAYVVAYPEPAVFVAQHDYTPRSDTKLLGQIQTTYARKNWSSVMLFNNAQCRALTPDYVNAASGLDLHRFAWVDYARIGRLPREWNYLVGESGQSEKAPKIVHFTNGGPWFADYSDVEFADVWRDERDAMVRVEERRACPIGTDPAA